MGRVVDLHNARKRGLDRELGEYDILGCTFIEYFSMRILYIQKGQGLHFKIIKKSYFFLMNIMRLGIIFTNLVYYEI